MFKQGLTYLLIFFLTPIIGYSQLANLEKEIQALTAGVNLAYSQDITSGSRVFLLSVKKDDLVPAYCRSRIEAEILNAFDKTKFSVVFQPFLQEKTLKSIESTDTTFKVSNQSSYSVEFGNMRALIDSLQDYNIDLLFYSKLFLSPANHLILKTSLVDVHTLKVISGYTFYGSPKEVLKEKPVSFKLSIYHGQSSNAMVSRSYGQSQALKINPFSDKILYDAASLGVYQKVSKNINWLSAGVQLNAENNYLKEFDDYIRDFNEFRITTFTVGPSLGLHIVDPVTRNIVFSSYTDAGYGKSEWNSGFYFISTQLQLKLTKRLSVDLRGRYYFTGVVITNPFYQDINFKTAHLCGGISLHI